LYTVISRSVDGSVKRSWKAELVRRESNELVLRGTFVDTVDHTALGTIEKGTVSTEYFWANRWFNVFRFEGTDGRLRNFYCNVAMPPKIDDKIVDYVDLEVDIVVWPDRRMAVLDIEEFDEIISERRIDEASESEARAALEEIRRMIVASEYPFQFGD
jgi:protein associated with RNAse G/E